MLMFGIRTNGIVNKAPKEPLAILFSLFFNDNSMNVVNMTQAMEVFGARKGGNWGGWLFHNSFLQETDIQVDCKVLA